MKSCHECYVFEFYAFLFCPLSTHPITDLQAIANTMDNLTKDGWPAVFIFLYDQPWKLALRLFDFMPHILDGK